MKVVPVLMATTLACAQVSCTKYRMDREMAELCKKDGGIKVYETVTLTPEYYDQLEKFPAMSKAPEDYYGPLFRREQRRDVIDGRGSNITAGEGRLTRYYTAVYRRSDGKLLGEQVLYGRFGGDFFTFGAHPSGKKCPELSYDIHTLVFKKGR